jgi:hypothetical protein
MVGNTKNSNLKDSNVAQISAFLYYQANVISKLEGNQAFQNKFRTIIFNQIEKDFSLYVDALARTKPKSLHHVYEWRKTGSPDGRLFNLKLLSSQGLSFRFDYDLLDSQSYVPYKKNRNKYKFAKKASVMEAGVPVIISPRPSKRLVFEVDGSTVFMPKGASVTVKSPGGKASTNQFKLAYSRFFSSDLVKASIMRSGFEKVFNQGMARALSIPSSIKTVKFSFSANRIRSQADAALASAFGGGAI